MPLTCEITARLNAKYYGTQDFGGPEFRPTMEMLMQLVDGVAAGQADAPPYFDERSVNASSNDDIDLSGVLTGPFGATIAFAKIVALLVINRPKNLAAPANVSNLTIGAGGNPFLGFLGGAAHTVGPIRPGGFLFLGAGDLGGIGTVTAGTADILRIANGAGGTAVYQIGIIGRTA